MHDVRKATSLELTCWKVRGPHLIYLQILTLFCDVGRINGIIFRCIGCFNFCCIIWYMTESKHLESFKMWCWRRMEKFSWTDHVRNEEVLLRVKEQRNIVHEISKRKANWIGHILLRNFLLQRVIEGKIKGGIEVTGRRGRRRRKLLDDLKEMRRYTYLKEEAVDRTMWRARFGRGSGPLVRQTTKWMNEWWQSHKQSLVVLHRLESEARIHGAFSLRRMYACKFSA